VSITSFWSGLAVGLIIGVLGRIVSPNGPRQIGCLLTILIGIVGAAIGTAIGEAIDAGSLIIFLIQVVVAALLVGLFGASTRR
jgi:uncharacterized membrane protein YeaQ/YmgE (transglycosylase-associated protein family)